MKIPILLLFYLCLSQNTYTQNVVYQSNIDEDSCLYIKDLLLHYRDDPINNQKITGLSFSDYSNFIHKYSDCIGKDTSMIMTIKKLGSDSLFLQLYYPDFINSHSYISDTLDYYGSLAEIVVFEKLLEDIRLNIGEHYLVHKLEREYALVLLNNLKVMQSLLRFKSRLFSIHIQQLFGRDTFDQDINKATEASNMSTAMTSLFIEQNIDILIDLGINTFNKKITDIVFDNFEYYFENYPNSVYGFFGKLIPIIEDFDSDNLYALERMKELLPEADNVTDSEGNVYRTVKIMGRWWMAENLKTTKFNDGTLIPFSTKNSEWRNSTSPAYCWNGRNSKGKITYDSTYGALYNWYVVNTRKVCPTDWHVPTINEWNDLMNELDPLSRDKNKTNVGHLLKEPGTLHWKSPNTNSNNATGFTALPAGERDYDGGFIGVNILGNWWSSTEFSTTEAWYWTINYYNDNVESYHNRKATGYSIRCVKD